MPIERGSIQENETPLQNEESVFVRLETFGNAWYDPGHGPVVRAVWYCVNAVCFDSWLMPFSAPKRVLLRLFGAAIGRGVVIKPRVNIKYPWRLSVGDHAWIGEGVWIDSLDDVSIGESACLSQGALLLCGNHDYRSESFDLIVKPISIGRGAWVGARATICGGVDVGPSAVVGVGVVAVRDVAANTVVSQSATRLRF